MLQVMKYKNKNKIPKLNQKTKYGAIVLNKKKREKQN